VPKLRSRDGIWYVDTGYLDGARFVRRERSTRVRDDGTAQSRRTAEARAREIEGALASGKGRRAGGETLRAAYAARLEQLELAGCSPRTLDIVGEKSVHVLRYFGPDADPADISAEELQAYAVYAREKRAPATVSREFVELRAAAKAIGVELPPSPDVGKPGVGERWIDTEQTRALLEHARPKRRGVTDWRPHIIVYRYLGLSYGELYEIRPQDVNRTDWTVWVGGTKTEYRRRNVPIVEHARAAFERGFRFARWGYGNGNRDLTRWARAADIVGVDERFSFNDLRRSFATELVLADVSTFKVSRLMGHVDEKMVARIYARVKAGAHMHDSVRKLEAP
jgi:integrase